MNGTSKMNGLILAFSALTSLSLIGCGGSKAKNGTLVQDSTSAGTNTSPTSSNFTLGASFLLPTPNYLHNATSGDWSGACQVQASNLQYPPVSAGSVGCILEASELDVMLSSITLSYSVPAGACDYVVAAPYFAWQYQPNIGASSFTENIDANGNMSISSASITPGNSALPAHTGVKVVNNTAVCQYDYRNNTPAGPNCCPGNYAATIITASSTGGAPTTVVSPGSWGGAVGNCAVGPGVTDSVGKDGNNMPIFAAVAASAGYASTVAIKDPSDLSFGSTMYAANYFPTSTAVTSWPGGLVASAYPSTGTSTVSPNPFYQFLCLTHARETKGRIILQIRKWNLASELARGSAGNWNTSGTEANGDPIDDYDSWEDVSAGSFPATSF